MIKNLDESVSECKKDKYLRDQLISDYRPFIRSVAKKTFSRYLEYGHDDELSIAMIAFNEAIDSYSPEKGHFLPFSAWVIKRRLIDYVRKNKNEIHNVSLDQEQTDDDEPQITSLDHLAILEYKDSIVSEFRRYEIDEYAKLLGKFDITFEDMYKCSPKHAATKELVDFAINYLAQRPDLVSDIHEKGTVPLKILTDELKVPRKTLERARKYIVGAVLMKSGDFNYLKGFIRWD